MHAQCFPSIPMALVHTMQSVTGSVGIDSVTSSQQPFYVFQTGDLLKENIELKSNVVTLKETINVHETESKASRETIMKLVSEINKEKKKNGSFVQQIDTLCKNLEMVSDGKQALEKEIVMLQDRLKASHGAWEACKQELNQVKKSSTELDVSLKSSIGEAKAARNLLDLFMDEVAAALSNSSITVKPKEEAILERIHDLQKMVESKKIYMKFLEQLSEKMKLDRITADVGFDMRLDVILARADQLVKLESDAVVENKTLAHGLQRKLKAQKEKFESKELHMELLRKKIAQLEEEKQVRTALAVERDEANLTVRTLQKKIKTLEQYKTIEKLNKSVEQLEKVKGKTEKRLLSIKSELDFTEREAKEEKDKTSNYVEVITSELKTLKKTLEDISKREKQM
ncbi:hypothetical protein AB205_0062450 [Aquarana catesbeiana]|uniref:Coiled-coil domain-containing protein 170 n=1 Tax=Aquarana catesbeiana TaxID=8400 RepID=A0A2G9RVA7_AQUCT|nr:hypothetical protein AB205_0062450 [Aquarana catesbeiana]